jgi:predicted GTPase
MVESEKCINLGFQVTKHPFLIENNEYHIIICLLNREQQKTVKDIALKKQLNMNSLVHVFLIGRVGIGKTFTNKALFQMLIRIYDSNNCSDPMKPKVLIVAYIGKVA